MVLSDLVARLDKQDIFIPFFLMLKRKCDLDSFGLSVLLERVNGSLV